MNEVNCIMTTRNFDMKEGNSNMTTGDLMVVNRNSNMTTVSFGVLKRSSNLISRSFEVRKSKTTRNFESEEGNFNSTARLFKDVEGNSVQTTGNFNEYGLKSNQTIGNFTMENLNANISSEDIWREIIRRHNEVITEDEVFVNDLIEFVFMMRKMSHESKRKTVKPQSNSTFTETIRATCGKLMTNRGAEMFFLWVDESRLRTQSPSDEIVDKVCKVSIKAFQEHPFCPKIFLLFFLVMCNHAVLYFNNGIEIAPITVKRELTLLLHRLRSKVDYTANFWKRIEAAAAEMKKNMGKE